MVTATAAVSTVDEDDNTKDEGSDCELEPESSGDDDDNGNADGKEDKSATPAPPAAASATRGATAVPGTVVVRGKAYDSTTRVAASVFVQPARYPDGRAVLTRPLPVIGPSAKPYRRREEEISAPDWDEAGYFCHMSAALALANTRGVKAGHKVGATT